MMKNLSFLVIVVIAICLAGFAFDWIASASPVHAGSDNRPLVSSDVPSNEGSSNGSPSINEAVSLTRSLHPAVLVITGLVCSLFGIIALCPLLIDDPSKY